MIRKGVFGLLIKNNILYLMMFLGSVIIGVVSIVYLSDTFDGKSAPKMFANDIVKSDYKNIETRDVEAIGGWVEILDKNLKVIFVKGDKKDKDKMSYSQNEIFEMLGVNEEYKISGFIKDFSSAEEELFLLVRYPEDLIEIRLVMLKYNKRIWIPLAYGVSSFIVLIVISTFFSVFRTRKKIVTPLEHILFGIKRMKNGEYVENMSFNGEREFQEIKDAFNDMNRKLRESHEEKQQIEINRNRIFRDLSHDLKTPITSIQGLSRILIEGRIDDEDKKERYYKTIYKKACRVGILVDNLFQYVKLNSPEMKIQLEEQDLCEFLRVTISEYYDEIQKKGMILDVIILEEEIKIKFDNILFQRAVSNIMENAIKYNSEGTTIRVQLKTSEGIRVEIGDDGVGIPLHIRENIFETFIRGDEARKSDGGTGLGLSIARKIVELHGWEILLKDENTLMKTLFEIIIK